MRSIIFTFIRNRGIGEANAPQRLMWLNEKKKISNARNMVSGKYMKYTRRRPQLNLDFATVYSITRYWMDHQTNQRNCILRDHRGCHEIQMLLGDLLLNIEIWNIELGWIDCISFDIHMGVNIVCTTEVENFHRSQTTTRLAVQVGWWLRHMFGKLKMSLREHIRGI